MAFKFLNFARIKKDAAHSARSLPSLDEIATDVAEKKKEIIKQRERVEDAIQRGTKITKRRIPL